MFNYVGYSCIFHICDMFNKILVMAYRGLIKVLLILFLLHHYFPISLLLLSYHSILGNDMGSGPEKVAQISGILVMVNWVSRRWQVSLLERLEVFGCSHAYTMRTTVV